MAGAAVGGEKGSDFLRREFVQMFEIFTMESLLKVMGIMVLSGVGICVASTFIVVNRLVGFDRDQVYSF